MKRSSITSVIILPKVHKHTWINHEEAENKSKVSHVLETNLLVCVCVYTHIYIHTFVYVYEYTHTYSIGSVALENLDWYSSNFGFRSFWSLSLLILSLSSKVTFSERLFWLLYQKWKLIISPFHIPGPLTLFHLFPIAMSLFTCVLLFIVFIFCLSPPLDRLHNGRCCRTSSLRKKLLRWDLCAGDVALGDSSHRGLRQQDRAESGLGAATEVSANPEGSREAGAVLPRRPEWRQRGLRLCSHTATSHGMRAAPGKGHYVGWHSCLRPRAVPRRPQLWVVLLQHGPARWIWAVHPSSGRCSGIFVYCCVPSSQNRVRIIDWMGRWMNKWVYEWMNEFLSKKVSMHRQEVAAVLSWQVEWLECKNRKQANGITETFKTVQNCKKTKSSKWEKRDIGLLEGVARLERQVINLYCREFPYLHADPEQFIVGPGCAVTGLRGRG